MKLIIDTNVIISSLLKDSKARELLLSETFEFYLPEIVLSEINKYILYIVQKSNLNEKEIKVVLNKILEKLNIVPIQVYEDKIPEALSIMEKIDKKDTQFIALALKIENDGLLTNDKHFQKQSIVKVYRIMDIIAYISKNEK